MIEIYWSAFGGQFGLVEFFWATFLIILERSDLVGGKKIAILTRMGNFQKLQSELPFIIFLGGRKKLLLVQNVSLKKSISEVST